VFNRSHYEDVLVVRVDELVPEAVWRPRYAHIVAFERLLHDAGTRFLKVYLHIDRDEQAKRLQRASTTRRGTGSSTPTTSACAASGTPTARPSPRFARTGTADAPWLIVPANRKWYRDVVVATALVEALEALPLAWPEPEVDLSAYRVDA
jgi:polyphosphate kinase 2 (PPK2 family)